MDALKLNGIQVSCFFLFVGASIHAWAQYHNVQSAVLCQTSDCNVCCNCVNDTCTGVCENGYHGKLCKNKCPDNCISCKDHSDNTTNQGYANCTQCKDGYYVTSEWFQCQVPCPSDCIICISGSNCSVCKQGFYGDSCNQTCSIGCSNNSCDKETGNCASCKNSFNGSKCDDCANGKFGVNCSSDCPENCQGKVCNMTSGDCISCKVGKYGRKCASNCSDNCLSENCSMANGECASCINGYFGGRCNVSCPEHCNSNNCSQSDGTCESCKLSFYGADCNEPCPVGCLNDTCDQVNGSCLDGCDKNFNGYDCTTCSPGWYGINCNQTCSLGCLNNTCDQVDGHCGKCKDNFRGNNCMSCTDGMKGRYCNQSCSNSCAKNQCNRFYGNCTSGCIANFVGPFCDQCIEGKFGINDNCSQNCNSNCQNGTCNMTSGICHGCKENYLTGDLCEECFAGFNGYHCNISCTENCLICSRENGTCLLCEDGFNGTNCEFCINGRYGLSCNQSCASTCIGELCNPSNGSCVQGCVDNFIGEFCDICKPGLFGFNCSENCPETCENGTCDTQTGNCSSCVGNFTGHFCDLCKTGLHGLKCLDVCSDNCTNKSCNQTTGFCESCPLFLYGQFCNQSCPENCLNRSCHRIEGLCSQGCSEGFSGKTCDTEILKISLSLLQIYIVAVASVLAALLAVILIIWLLHKKRLSKHEGTKDDHADLMPNESNNDATSVVEKSEPRMTHGYVNVVLDQNGHKQLDDTSIHDRPNDIDVQPNRRINGDLEDNSFIRIRSTGNEGASASKAEPRKSPPSSAVMSTLPYNARAEAKTERSETVENNATMAQITPLTGSRMLSQTPRGAEGRVTVVANESAWNAFIAKESKSIEFEIDQRRFLDKSEVQVRNKTVGKRDVKSQILELRAHSRKPNRPQTNLVKDQHLRAFSVLYTNHSQRKDGSISLDGLADYVRLRDESFYQEEFLKLPKGLIKSCNDATKPENMGKNRYNGIYPYDETRVKLEGPSPDYINACFVNGYKKKRQFIAALGPIKKATENFKTFWLMIWQQKVEKIVMVTNLREQGSMKCEKYWPDKDDSNMYGQVKVACTNIQEYSEFVIRTFIIEKDRECHLLLHYHFTAWPDKAAPEEVTSIIDLRHIVNATKPIWAGPVVVHCSAGIGRTGTYIALDYLTEQGQAEGYLDVFRCVCDLRQQRTSMVQKWEQYRYIHQALVQSLLLDSDPVALAGFRDYAADEQRLAMVFKKQDLLIETPDDEDKEAVIRNESLVHLNREGADIPGDLHRVRLYLHRSHGDCDYINAVYVDSFLKKNQYIIAQTPLRATVKDFLMMVVQERCPCIVSLEDTRPDQNVGIYVPRDNKSRLSIAPELGVSCSEVIETDAYVKKVLTISSSLDTGSSIHTVSHFRFKGWKESDDAPSRVTEFIELVEDVADTVQEGDGPIIIHCLNGGGRSGLFCLMSTLLEKLDSVREVSVVNAIRRVRYRRPVGIQNLEQFLFCYRALSEYLKITAETASLSFENPAELPPSKISRQSRINLAENMAAMLDEPDEHVYGNMTF